MTDETPDGVLLKGADGSYYFIPATDLSQYAAPQVTDKAGSEVANTAPRLDAFSIDPSQVDPAVAMIIGPDN
jgi:hypothetical protein